MSDSPLLVYLDLNVFNDLEKVETLDAKYAACIMFIKDQIESNRIVVPYSNAHISDLRRGHSDETKHYIEQHLNNISYFTRNLAIVQYWGRDDVTWHYRDIHDFFEESLIDPLESHSFSSMLLEVDQYGILKLWLELISTHELDPLFQKVFNVDPIMKLMFSTARKQMTLLSFCEDLFSWQKLISKDYSVYKAFKKYLIQSYNQLRNNPKMLTEIRKNMPGAPQHLQLPEAVAQYIPQTTIGKNQKYNRFTDNFYRLDLSGFKPDDRFANLIDDSIHAFYGSNCAYFLSKDERCLAKAIETYKRLGISTIAMKPEEFMASMIAKSGFE